MGFTDNLRPNLIPGGNNNPTSGVAGNCAGAGARAGHALSTPEIWYDPCQFVPSELGYYGNVGANTLTTPGLASFDFSILKDFNVTENSRIQFRAEYFNFLNRPNFDSPTTNVFDGGVPNPLAGQISQTNTSAREIQFGLRFIF